MAKKLLSLPRHLAENFNSIRNTSPDDWFCSSDPAGHKLGSGGGTVWLLEQCREAEGAKVPFGSWLGAQKRILIHACGQSRRLPAYAPSGKVLTPVPVFRWKTGQRFDQTLLDLQLPLYERMMKAAPQGLNTLVASGDVYVRTSEPLPPVPQADVVCYGLWAEAAQARNHGVFMIRRDSPDALDFMLQKPSPTRLAELAETHFFLMDIGIWLLSDKAVMALSRHARQADGRPCDYDLYGQFGCALGQNPQQPEADLGELSVAVVSLQGGEFYHFGTSHDLLASTTALQNLVKDQRRILQREVKPQPSVFTQNCMISNRFTDSNNNIWVENSCVPDSWTLTSRNIITGVPQNSWRLRLDEGVCLDMVPVGKDSFCLRPYGFSDQFRGSLSASSTRYLEQPVTAWLARHNLRPADFQHNRDIQEAELFPVSRSLDKLRRLLLWMTGDGQGDDLSQQYLECQRLSADQLASEVSFERLESQRRKFRATVLPYVAANWTKSVFYQVNLAQMAAEFAANNIELPRPLPETAPMLTRARDLMFRAETLRLAGKPVDGYARRAYDALRSAMVEQTANSPVLPRMDVCSDQIVWARSSVRIDFAGGWTDTPPYSIMQGGSVVNMAIDLNGQPPIQVYVKPCAERHILCRSIDLGTTEIVSTFEELGDYCKVGSAFSIPKAALALSGFLPQFCSKRFDSLEQQLEAFGGGLELTLMSAIPAGSGLGTSSVLAATVLGALANFSGLAWDKNEICTRSLILEQMLTTGGGWQDQYGGALAGVKLLQTSQGTRQMPVARWLPDSLFTADDFRPCHLLYYTGLTRTAKNILQEIVRKMFLNDTAELSLLKDMKTHAINMHNAIQLADFSQFGSLVRTTWQQNRLLDRGTSTPQIKALCRRIDDLCLGYKLPGAGGGGFLYMVAKDAEAARRLRKMLADEPLTPNARFVEMSLSKSGLQVSRS